MSLSKKKRWKRTVICIMVFCVCASVIALGFLINNGHSVKGANITNLPGAGTVNNPFRISSRADLDFLANAINAPVTAPDRFAHLRGATRHFVLTNNIDMGGMFNPWTTPIGHGTAANRFSGVFDGNGHTISNLFFDSNVAVNNYGLFGVTTSATIRNLNLHQATIMVDGAGTNIAPLVGHAMQITHIENVSVSSGSSVMAGLSVGVGGLVGRSIGTSADAANSFRLSSSGATVIGSSLVGGLVGIGTSSTFRECFASGTVEGTLLNTVVGGFIGEIAATTRVGNAEVLRWAFYNNYASGQVIASNTQGSPTTIAVGGFVGRVIGATRMTNVYASGNIMVNAEAGTIRVGGLVGHALATTEIVGSAAIMQQINQSGGTRHIGLLAAGAAPTSTTINRNNMMNSQMMNIFAEGVPIGADIQIGTVFSAAINSNRLVPFSGFSNQQTWTDVPTVVAGVQGYDNFDFNLTWAIDPNVNRGHPILRGFQNEEGYSGGTGTPNNPFRIDTLSDFLRFRQNVARGNTYANRHFNLTANINLMEENWTPIPNFLGTFDGGGNIISGLSITSRTVNDTGLFALLGIGGAIRNLTLLNPSVTGITGQNTGLLVGRALNNTIIENITITNGFVESRNINTGGLVGYSHGTAIATGNTIRNISVGGTILASGQTGGIIGRAEFTTMSIVGFNGEVLRNATGNLAGWHNFGGLIGFATGGENRISNSFARANIRDACSEFSVSTIAATAGGLVGFNGVAIRISNSYYAGGIIEAHTQSVTANAANSAYAGGLIGFSNTAASILVSLTNNFVASSTILARADTPNLENLFFVSASNFLNSPANRIPTMQNNMYSNDVVTIMNNAQITTGIPYDVGINVPRVNLSTVSFWTLGAFVGGLGWDFNNVWTLGGVATGNLPVHRTMFEDADFGGRGTIENPYRIRTAGDLRNMRDMVNQGNRFRGRFFRMENDIDLGGSTWTPIGLTDIITFAGNFDGGGYQISGLNVNRTIDNKGFFGHTTGATVENLTLHEPQVQRTTGHNTGALIGRALSTVVSNIHIEGGEISADPSADEIGTVIGRADAGTSLYRVSSNALLSQGRHGAGGLIGFAVGTAAAPVVITHSYFAGNITTQGAHYVGGLVGISRGVIIDQSYNAGSITVRARTIGGLIGHNYSVPSTIRNSYNIGNLTITFNRISGASTTARNALLNLGGIVANTWGVPVAMENVINLGELRQVNTWSVVSIGGIYGRADASLGNTMFGAVSAGKLHLESLVRSRAWFANGSAATNIPLPAGRGGLLWLDELDTAITRAVVGTAAANLRLHDDEDAEAKTREQLNIWQTYEDIGFNSDIWAIDPSGEINMGFPYLRDVETVMPRTGSGSMRLEITSTEEFLEFRDAVNAGNSFIGLTILVKTDIHLTGIFQQIGQITTPFSGTIDFGGHTIYGLNIQGSATNTGLFGYANRGAVIKNLYIHDPNVRGTANVGGLIGHANGDVAIYNVHITGDSGLVHGSGGQVGGFIGRITNGFNVSIRWSSSNATVRGVADTGGFVGLSISTWGNQNLIADSFKTGNVESTGSDVGGLIGEARNARIERSYTSGIVRSTLDNVGGLVGAPRIMRVDIVDSFSTSSVIGRNRVGGLVGATIIATTITNSYARGLVQSTVTTTAAASLAGIIGENHRVAIASIRMEGVAAINRGVIAPRTTTGARMASVAVGDNSDALTPTVAHSPGTTFLANMNVGLASTVRLFGHPLQNTNPAWLPAARRPESRTLEEYQNLETFVQKGWSEDVWEIRAGYNDNLPLLRNLPFVADERLGSESNPILINNLDELVQFRNSVNAGNTFFGQVVRLTDSINLADEEWLPIGSSVVNHFGGTFEGGGHFIRNMTITRSAAQTGFFGFTNAATIRNLGFVNVNITSSNTSSTADTGVVIGQSMSTLVLDRVVVFGGNVQASGQNT
ncbi:MAG: hypothetical protein FWE01_03480, partial [Firmicutes bacterium]|nr:hypothetical protein [Bacillota bacterium]